MEELSKANPDMIVNISASPFDCEHNETRRDIFTKNAIRYKLPLFFANHIGAQTELIFDGGSMVINSNGNVAGQLKSFEEDFKIFSLDEIENTETSYSDSKEKGSNKIKLINEALILGIKDYFKKLGFEKAILGLSGGVDSAVTLVLAIKALGKENVKAILMPSRFSSDHSINDAKKLVHSLGCNFELINIKEITKSFDNALKPHFKDLPFGLAEENIQARARAVLLMALSNKFGYILLNTSNKSETAVGYGTLYGDMCGGLSVLGDVYKTEVYELAQYINKDEEIIPQNTITKPPSAELRPGQKDTDSLPEYDVLDKILYQYIEQKKSPKEIIAVGFDEQLVEKILRLVNTNEYKRYQTPPILRISTKAFGMGRRMPIVGKYLS